MPFLFADAPQRVYWELTRACDLSCTHCRANAIPRRDPRELSTTEICDTLDALANGAAPHVILTGGDPLKRADFFAIVAHTVSLGLPCLVAPSATPLLTSVDGSTPAHHDGLRGVPGTFDRTLKAAREIVASGIPLQINTLVTDETRHDLPAIHQLVQGIGAERWSLFFLITTGRGETLRQITPEQSESILNWALDHAGDARPIVTTTEAPHYRRLAVMRHATRIEHQPHNAATRRGLGIRDGNGVMFISHTGDVQPSGFLQIYRNSPLFQSLRRTDLFEGRCSACEFREICGGSRARAYAATGNPLASDPLCPYEPGHAHAPLRSH
jgi:MoaA/NifB/PqqE/SkfB family radical SAM enzyme